MQLPHREMFPVAGQKRQIVRDGDGGNGDIGIGESLAFRPPVASKQPGSSGDLRRNWKNSRLERKAFV